MCTKKQILCRGRERGSASLCSLLAARRACAPSPWHSSGGRKNADNGLAEILKICKSQCPGIVCYVKVTIEILFENVCMREYFWECVHERVLLRMCASRTVCSQGFRTVPLHAPKISRPNTREHSLLENRFYKLQAQHSTLYKHLTTLSSISSAVIITRPGTPALPARPSRWWCVPPSCVWHQNKNTDSDLHGLSRPLLPLHSLGLCFLSTLSVRPYCKCQGVRLCVWVYRLCVWVYRLCVWVSRSPCLSFSVCLARARALSHARPHSPCVCKQCCLMQFPFSPPNLKKIKKFTSISLYFFQGQIQNNLLPFPYGYFLAFFSFLSTYTTYSTYSTYSFLQCPYALDEVLSNQTLLSSLFDKASLFCVSE